MELFKGYVITKNKQSIEPLKGRTDFRTLDEVENAPEYAGVLNDPIILVDLDDEEESDILFDIVEDKNLCCRVYQTTRGKHFLFKNYSVDNNKTRAKTGINLTADMKLGLRNSYEVIKFGGKKRKILYDKTDENGEYQNIPKWLTPVKTTYDFYSMKPGDGRNQSFFNYILTLQTYDFTVEEARECIRLINDYVLGEPLSDQELDTILRDEAFQKPIFYQGKTLLHDRFARYLKNNNHIMRINGVLHMYKEGIYRPGTTDIESQMIKLLPGLKMAQRREVLAYLEVLITENINPADANFMAFKNGVYDMVTDQFKDFDPDTIITNRINWNYNPATYSLIADHTLNKMACDDPEIRCLLEEVIGYCFYRRNELRKAFILIGDRANGKSTYLDMIKSLLGDMNTAALDLKELGDRFKTAELFGKLANIGDDIGDEFIPNPAIFKKLVSGDRVSVERKGKDPFEFNNYSKFLFSANNIPRIKDKTGAVLDRLVIIPFNAVFSKDDPDFDPYIKYKLREPEVMEYLINIGLQGLKRVLENNGFTVSTKVQKELESYEEQNNPILLFFKECGRAEIINQSTKDIYMQYSVFCAENNMQPMSNIEFSKQVKKKFDLEIMDKRINGKKRRIFRERKK